MAPGRKKGSSRVSAAAARRRQWNVGDLVLAKVKGFPAWPATVSEPEKWGYSKDSKKVLVYFFGTKQIAFCSPADVEAFTEEKKQALLVRRQTKGADFVRAVREIINSYDKSKKQNQVDGVFSGDEVTVANVEESQYFGVNNESKAQRDIPTVTLNLQLKTSSSAKDRSGQSLPVDNVAATKLDALHDRGTLCNEETDNLLATEAPPLLSTYSSMKSSRGTHPQNIVIPKKAQLDIKSRNSPRVELCRSQNFTMPSSGSSKSSGDVAVSLLQDGSSRWNQCCKFPDVSTFHDVDSPSYVANGSIEDNGSEVATVDSDTRSCNESSTIEFESQHDDPDMVVECLEENVGLNKKLDLLTKAVVTKRKRNPQRKRVNCDAGACSATSDGDTRPDIQNQNIGNVSPVSEKLNKVYTEKDGDEHLPLLKRARVRMGQSLYVEENVNSSTHQEEKFTIKIKGCLSGQVCTPLNCSVSASADGDVHAVKNAGDNSSLSKNCNPVIEPMPTFWNVKKNKSYSCRVDVEAVLPPSKRFHRAMEAMSANAGEDASLLTEAPSAMEVVPNGYCASPMHIYSNTATECESRKELGVQNVESLNNAAILDGSSGSSPHSSLTGSKAMAKSSLREDICNQLDLSCNSEGLNHQICKEMPSEATNCCVSTHLGVLSSGNVGTVGQVQSAQPSSPEERLNKLWHPNAEGNDNCFELSSNGAGKEYKHFEELNSLENPVESPNHDLGTEKPIKVSHQSQDDLLLYRIEGCCSEDAKFLNPQQDEDKQVDIMCKIVKDFTHKSRMTDINDSPYQRSLEIRTSVALVGPTLSCSPAAYPDRSSDKDVSCIPSSPCSAGQLDSPTGIMSSDSAKVFLSNVSYSIDSQKERNVCMADDVEMFEASDAQIPIAVDGLSNHVDASAALKSFEAMLLSLTGTKGSIGRSTSVAIDCAMFGVASEVVEILARKMETESRLHKRVDLFLLVDSITQCSQVLKGDVKGTYPSAILSVLPRLLSAVVPPGNVVAQGNRKLCLKVLRLWVERGIFPESIIRHHTQELNSPCGSSSIGSISQCSSRAERAFHDPVREMEGLLVNEYGSNSNFQLPGFVMPQMLDEDDESDSDGEKFEAVTPEHNLEIPKERELFPLCSTERHSHILEDVDGELEMEDVAPSSEEVKYNVHASHHQSEHHFPLPNAPPLPSDMPPSSPPLPTSPLPPAPSPPLPTPPLPPAPSPASAPLPSSPPLASAPLPSSPPLASAPPPSSAMQHSFANNVDSKHYLDTHTVLDSLKQPMAQQSSSQGFVDSKMLDSTHYHAPEHRNFLRQKQTVDYPSSCSFRSFPGRNSPKRSVNCYQSKGSASLRKKAFHLQPPHLASSIQLCYDKGQMPPRREDKPLAYSTRHSLVQHVGRRYIYNDHDRLKSTSFDIGGRARFSASSFPHPESDDRGRGLLPYPFIGPPCESERIPSQRWAFPSRGMKHTHFIPIGFPFENPVLMTRRAPRFWRQR